MEQRIVALFGPPLVPNTVPCLEDPTARIITMPFQGMGRAGSI